MLLDKAYKISMFEPLNGIVSGLIPTFQRSFTILRNFRTAPICQIIFSLHIVHCADSESGDQFTLSRTIV